MDDVSALPSRHRLDVEAYHMMGKAGVFGIDERIELIDGELFDMAPIGQGHAAMVTGLTQALVVACAGRALVSPGNPVLIDRSSEPQPDLAVLRSRADFYATGERPGPADVLLLVEVSDSSLRYDRTVKLPLYARAGIGECWIVDLRRRVLEAHRQPAGGAYTIVETHGPGDHVALSMAPEIGVALDLLFG